jgi:putative MATE family efflux protein
VTTARTVSGAARLSLMALAWPLFVEQGLRILIATVDTFMVSHVSDAAVGALGVATQVLVLSIIVFNFIGIGSSVVITHHLGAGDRPGADRIAAAAIGVNTWIGLVVSATVALLAGPILRLLQLPPEPLRLYALPFLTILGGTLFIDAQNLAMSAVLRAHGRTREAMVVSGAQNVLNVLGNCLVLFVLVGPRPQAVAWIAANGALGRLISFVALRVLVARRTGIWLGWRDYLTFPLRELSRILHIGLPAAGENIAYWLAFMTVTSFASRLGPGPLATVSYARSITTWVTLFALSIGLGTEILVGRLIGAGAFDEAYHRLLKSLRTGLTLVGCGTLVLALASPFIMRAFTHDPAIIRGGIILIVMGLVIEPGRVFNIVVINSLRATGDARFPVMMGASSMWGVWVPLACVLSLFTPLGVIGIWIAMACDEWLRGIMMYTRWKRRRWVKYAKRSHASVAALGAEAAAAAAGTAESG